MPTYAVEEQFGRDFRAMARSRQLAFLWARNRFIEGLRSRQLHPALRVKRVVRHAGVWEMTRAPDGRATFSYGAEIISGQPHIIWRRMGTHDIFRQP